MKKILAVLTVFLVLFTAAAQETSIAVEFSMKEKWGIQNSDGDYDVIIKIRNNLEGQITYLFSNCGPSYDIKKYTEQGWEPVADINPCFTCTDSEKTMLPGSAAIVGRWDQKVFSHCTDYGKGIYSNAEQGVYKVIFHYKDSEGNPGQVENLFSIGNPDISIEDIKSGIGDAPETPAEEEEETAEEPEESPETPEEVVEDPEDEKEKEPVKEAEGCEYGSSLVMVKERFEDEKGKKVYCSPEGSIIEQKAGEEPCKENYECLSNACSEGKCTGTAARKGLIGFILNLLSKIFG
ncbi:hypothetical protein JXC34_07135 [Candidatus Woesearchaeota archaeon]|nr:hypothetical protein [Candidatus Woesearchaeota archaeon]